MTRLIHWWLTPNFPEKHIQNILAYKPTGLFNQIRNFIRTWVVHPIKRRVSKYYLWSLQSFFDLKVIGITGSAGKTTTKEMLASILRLSGKTIYSFANIDPVYNIPTTILRCRPSTKFLILEMGIEYHKEMDFYLWLAKPLVGIITNIYPTHTVYFKNEEGIFKEKSKLVKNLNRNGYAILNSENNFLNKLIGKLKSRVIWFGKGTDIYVTDTVFTKDFKSKFKLHIYEKNFEINLPIPGNQFIGDALAAISAAYALEISDTKIKKGLLTFKNQDHRMKIKKLKSGAILIDDSYNNNPMAAKEAIQTLKDVSGTRKTLLVFGDMLELGHNEVKYHEEIGKFIKMLKINYVVGVGDLSRHVVSDKSLWVKTWQDAIPVVKPLLSNNLIVLVKGSRSINLDKLIERI